MGTVTSFRPGRVLKWRMPLEGAPTLARDVKAKHRLPRLGAIVIAALCAATGFGETANAASKLQTLYSFQNLRGAFPKAGVIADGTGNLYGTTAFDGAHGDGVVFELSPPPEGKKNWTETVLHSFGEVDGKLPLAGLIADSAGNLYGTTNEGGEKGGGVAFELSPTHERKKAWTERVLYSFYGLDGEGPSGSLIADGAGNLYGMTDIGGANGDGAVFELSPPGEGHTKWNETVLYSFNGSDGRAPSGVLLADGAGNLFGTTQNGGAGHGVVFELSPPTSGRTAWTETVLYAFHVVRGDSPLAGVIADGAGNLYGTTANGGANGDGAVFELRPPGEGHTKWNETVLYSFSGSDAGGSNPFGGLLADGAGNLYGTGANGGLHDSGVAFKLSPPAEGHAAWTETVLWTFSDNIHGGGPEAGLIADGAGNLYGTTEMGGKHGDGGIVFKITP